jgi:predicted N-acetyltransferase YhbS
MRRAVFMKPPMAAVSLRQAEEADLAALNAVIERAVMTWNLPERVKRLSLSTYRYQPHDLEHLHLVVAEDAGQAIIGVAAWESANARDLPADKRGLLLHGLYIDPAQARRGVGGRLLEAALDAAREQGCDGLLVKAQSDAAGFFAARGMQPLPVVDIARDYPYRFWQALGVH